MMKSRLLSAVFLGSVVWAEPLYSASCREIPFLNGVEIVELSGVLSSETHWGPPNFGETPDIDSRFNAWILNSDKKFKVKRMSGRKVVTLQGINKVQLFFLSEKITNSEISAMRSKHIFVWGRLWDARTPGDVTEINLVVEKAVVKEGFAEDFCING